MFRRFDQRLAVTNDVFFHWYGTWSRRFEHADRMFLEGLLSAVWQHWCLFCRRVIFASALGCETKNGLVMGASVDPTTWERVSYVSQRIRSRRRVEVGGTNSILRYEPTWGDVNVLVNLIQELQPDNAATLSAIFGGVTGGPIHVQTIRNAAAHRNHQTLADIRRLMPYYVAKRVSHPVEALLWEEPRTRDFAIVAWISEMRIVGERAIE
jgi:hypothetical protein